MFNKKIEFFSSIPGVEKVMPIVPSSQITYDWKQVEAHRYKEALLKSNNPSVSQRSLLKCPGITSITSLGWILRTWQDVYIETNGDGSSFNWKTPINQTELVGYDYISPHVNLLYESKKESWPVNTLTNIIKFSTGWRVCIPKNHTLLQLPVQYGDDNRFTAISGSYSYDYRIAELNVPVYWHALNSKELIKAGTPLAHLILIPDHQYKAVSSVYKNSSIFEVYHMLFNSVFNIDNKNVKEKLKKLF